MPEAFICDAARTPIGRWGGALASVRADDLAAVPLAALVRRNPTVDWEAVDDVLLGCANQAGEDNRNVARMALLLAGLPPAVPGGTVNRLCGSGLDAVAMAARMIKSGDAELVIAGGVESMSRAPYVIGKSFSAYSRDQKLEDTTIGWRLINPKMRAAYGTDSMPETAENVAAEYGISRVDQDTFALQSQLRAAAAQKEGGFDREIVSVAIPQRKGEPIIMLRDEHLRATSLEALAALKPATSMNGTITAGNSSGINDGAAAMIIASESAVRRYGLSPRARIAGAVAVGVLPRVMGIGPLPATQKLLHRSGLGIGAIGLIELNEAFAAQALAVTRGLGLADDAAHVNPKGGAIALGHPLGMSGARLALTAALAIEAGEERYGVVTMCIGVGQGFAMLLEKIS